MNDGRFVYRGKYVRTSFLWLVMAFVFGGSPLIVYFTRPGAPAANLAAAVVVGLPLFAVSVYFLLRYRGLILHPSARRLLIVEGVFRWKKERERSFDDVLRVRLLNELRGKSRHCVVELLFRDGSAYVVEEFASTKLVLELAGAIGVPGFDQEKLIFDPRPG